MTPSPRTRFDNAVCEAINWGAVLDVLQAHMHGNAKSSQGMVSGAFTADYRTHLLSPNEARAFDFIVTMAGAAAEELRAAYEAVDMGTVEARR